MHVLYGNQIGIWRFDRLTDSSESLTWVEFGEETTEFITIDQVITLHSLNVFILTRQTNLNSRKRNLIWWCHYRY